MALLMVMAACERLLVDPSAGPPGTGSIALSLAGGPSFQASVDQDAANLIRIQVTGGEAILLDSILPFSPGTREIVLPIRPVGEVTTVTVRVELRNGARPLRRGSANVELLETHVTDVEVPLSPAPLVPLTPLRAISAGIYHTCAALESGRAYCWGLNDAGQLGDNSLLSNPVPVAVATATAFRSIQASYVTTCALSSAAQGLPYCWGTDTREALGNGDGSAPSPAPNPVAGEMRFASLSVGGLHACGLDSVGRAFCWGFNEYGQLGVGDVEDRATPTEVDTGLRFNSISVGYLHTCGIATDGRSYCWGLNELGQLGDNTIENRLTPVPTFGGPGFVSISAGGLHTCAIDATDAVYCWGYNSFGQGGVDPAVSWAFPVEVPSARLRSVVAGGLHTCGLDVGGRAYCWGYNRTGALGDGSTADRAAPVAVQETRAFRAITAGLHHSCGIATDGTALCWGYNGFGQVGDGTTDDRTVPTEVLDNDVFFAGTPAGAQEAIDAVRDLIEGRVRPN